MQAEIFCFELKGGALKEQCCPNTNRRKVTRSVHEVSRDVARSVAQTACVCVGSRAHRMSSCLRQRLKISDGGSNTWGQVRLKYPKWPDKTRKTNQNNKIRHWPECKPRFAMKPVNSPVSITSFSTQQASN
jgi:hypothetical protein